MSTVMMSRNWMAEDTMENENETYIISKEEEAKLNAKMKVLLIKSIELKEAAERGDDNINYVEMSRNILRKADYILKKAKCSSTAYLDSVLVYTHSLIYKNLEERMGSILSEFNAKDYADNILQYLVIKAGNQNLWPGLKDETELIFNNTGGWKWHLGTFDTDECPRAPKRRVNRDILVDLPKRNPKKVQSLEKEEEDLEQHMETIMSILCKWENAKKETMQFWNLVLHPTSFSETVENMFHISHLVRERLVYLSMDRHGLPILKVCKNSGKIGSENNSVAVSLDIEEWEELVDAFNIKSPMIPTRISS